MEELARIYGRSLFEAARAHGKLNEIREQLGQFADALNANRELSVFFFSPYFSVKEKQGSLDTLLVDADEIVQRARQAAETHEKEAKEHGQGLVSEAAKRAEREIETATQRALDDIRQEVADLTIMATEKVTRKTLDDEDQRKLVEQALGELDFSSLSSGASQN